MKTGSASCDRASEATLPHRRAARAAAVFCPVVSARIVAVTVVVALLVGCAGPSPVPVSEPSTETVLVPRPSGATLLPRDIPVPFPPAVASSTSSKPATEPNPYVDPFRLATDLVGAEGAIRRLDVAPAELVPWAWAQQQAYRDLVLHPEWRAQVRASVPPQLQPAFDANLRAGVRLREMTRPRTELPDWHIVPPPAPEELRAHYAAAAAEFGVAWEYLAAIHLIETRMGRIRGVSVAGARGPMQFLPSTWAEYGEGDIDDPRDAIRAAARYLAAHGAPRDMRRALYAYNHSAKYVEAVEGYASVMRADPLTYRGYYHWRVYYRTTSGDVVLNEGWTGQS